jgi:hypothetical protein
MSGSGLKRTDYDCLQKEIIWNEQAITTRTEDRAPVSTPDSVDIFILGS